MGSQWLVLDALGEGGVGRETLRRALEQEARGRGKTLEVVRLDAGEIRPCLGCFGCWTKTPGLCRLGDAAQALPAKFVTADLVILLTPVVFGGYAPSLKIAFERGVLPTLLPFFQTVSGRTRHLVRYPDVPDLVALGWTARPEPEAEQVFAGVTARNAANMSCRRHASCVVSAEDGPSEVQERLGRVLSFEPSAAGHAAKNIVVLNGSPKKSGSVSAALGRSVEKVLTAAGTGVTTMSLAKAHGDEDAFEKLARAVDAADGVCLTYPLYADQLPGQVIEVLARLAAWRREIPPSRKQRLMAVANCGFPEAQNNDASLEMCRLFAAQAGFAWMGGCSVGGGGFYEGREIEAFGWMSRKARAALSRKAGLLLAEQEPDFTETGNITVPCPVPAWMYLYVADRGWKKALRKKEDGPDGYAQPFARAEQTVLE